MELTLEKKISAVEKQIATFTTLLAQARSEQDYVSVSIYLHYKDDLEAKLEQLNERKGAENEQK